ncbi:MAG: hypothetical protein JNN10_18820 [Sphingopyxis sp.]|uniref:hypothetical protein n=1 Tax=Sphingopyxis sp. TaxID=1908224 RepID=UPI001A5FB311|nr:hypothetical protein [Sphingopyxis sp.]MBL9068339.1 hypothetical protein [Sphingopyxis sp.]
MALRPFGFGFELKTPLGLAESKSRIRECKRHWYDPSEGPRGFILGRFICLWNSLINSQGPMMIGWLFKDGSGCRIKGQSGSDLNGTFLFVFAGIMLPIVAVMAFRNGQGGTSFYVMVAMCMVALVFLLIAASNDRRDGLTLVHFLQTAIGGDARHEFR